MGKSENDEFDLSQIPEKKPECSTLTFWVPLEIKSKFDAIQIRSERAFGKFLKDIIAEHIQRVKLEDKAG